MRIVADENIPFVNELFGKLGEVKCLPGRHISADDLREADALLVRSVTPVNHNLLAGSSLKFVGTCTIGVDHLDTSYLKDRGIPFASAPGCNANAVVQYVISVLARLEQLHSKKNVVVVGGGNVGSRVYRALSALGFRCRCVDPFLDNDSGLRLAEFSSVYSADIICLHTPYTTTGAHPTHHMFGEDQLRQLSPNAILINAGRGGVIDNHALLAHKKDNAAMRLVLDVWENEPAINAALLDQVDLGTPHIAGYSLEGRVTGSLMIFESMCRIFNIDPPIATLTRDGVKTQAFGLPVVSTALSLSQAVLAVYDVDRDFQMLLSVRDTLASSFDRLRKHYPMRREFSHYRLPGDSEDVELLRNLGFIVDV